MFSILHTASVTFPFVTSIVYWLVLHPSESIFDHARKGGNFDHFVLISTTVLNSSIAFVEVMVLSSGRMQKVFSPPVRQKDLSEISRTLLPKQPA